MPDAAFVAIAHLKEGFSPGDAFVAKIARVGKLRLRQPFHYLFFLPGGFFNSFIELIPRRVGDF